MTHGIRAALILLAAASAALPPEPVVAQQPPERAVRRDIPLTNTIQRAHAAGTRDSTGLPGPHYWQTRVDYRIDAVLDATTSQITGRQSTVIHNNGREPMQSIVLRLDQNIFRPDAVRGTGLPELTEGIRITRLSVNGEPVDLGVSPRNDGNAVVGLDRTVATITLANPVSPGMTATLDLDWHFRVSRPEARGLRHGAWGDSLVQAAQWYPRVAAYDDLRGWDMEPYLGPSEFYNNFGSFDVRIDVPGGWIVGATGTLQNPQTVLTGAARERLARVLQTDDVVTIVRRGGTRSRPRDRAGRTTGLAFPGRQRKRLRVGCIGRLRLAGHARRRTGTRHDPAAHPLHPQPRTALRSGAGGRTPLARVLLRSVGAVRVSAAHRGGWPGAGYGVPDADHVGAGCARP
jgi:hypothetical protein